MVWTPLNETEICGVKMKSSFDLCSRPKVAKVKAWSSLYNREHPYKEIDLYLTAPIITAWTYQLASTLHKGNQNI